MAFIIKPPVPAVETHVCGVGEGMPWAQQCAVYTTVHGMLEVALPRPLSREFLLLSQTLQGAPPDSQALGVAFVL